MKLSDLIIEHGPYQSRLDHIRPGLGGLTATADELNELRDELIAARKAGEERQRFEITTEADRATWVRCHRCGAMFMIDEGESLAELNRRADEHAEECRG